MADRAVPDVEAAHDDLFPPLVRPRTFALLWALLLVLITALTVVIVLYVEAGGR